MRLQEVTMRFFLGCAVLSSLLLMSPAPAMADGPTTAPAPRDPAEVAAVLAKAPKMSGPSQPIHLIIIAGPKDHGPGEHDYPAFQKSWPSLLGKAPNTKVSTAWEWPKPDQWEGVDVAVCYLRTKWTKEQINDIRKLQSRGGGVVLVHWAIAPDQGGLWDEHRALVGLNWKRLKYRHGALDLKLTQPNNPITLGLPSTIHVIDEAYWPMEGDMSKITLLATSDEKTIDTEAAAPMPMFWTYQPAHGGRAFVCILGHYMWTFDDPFFRLMLMRGIAWSANKDVYRFDALATDPMKTLEK
jgi:type 1 glutamine amidotransferase